MGAPMAKNLLKSKYEVKVFNRTKNKSLKLTVITSNIRTSSIMVAPIVATAMTSKITCSAIQIDD